MCPTETFYDGRYRSKPHGDSSHSVSTIVSSKRVCGVGSGYHFYSEGIEGPTEFISDSNMRVHTSIALSVGGAKGHAIHQMLIPNLRKQWDRPAFFMRS